jgi:hypothetical protein
MYTGNDDNIIADLLTEYKFIVDGKEESVFFKGGLLGHWAVWTHQAVQIMDRIKFYRKNKSDKEAQELLSLGVQVTDANASFFDPAHNFHGCIPGIHEVLRRQELLEGRWCLNSAEELSEGQMEEIDRIYKAYPHLNDDAFVKAFLSKQTKV